MVVYESLSPAVPENNILIFLLFTFKCILDIKRTEM